MGAEPEQFLHADIDARAAIGLVVNGVGRSGRRRPARRRVGVQPALRLPGNQAQQRAAEVDVAQAG